MTVRTGESARELRHACRSGALDGPTSGRAPGYVQGNLVILPAAYAVDFRAFCERNPKPCPIIAVSEPGAATLPGLGEDLDVRTDAPRYQVWADGRVVDRPTDVLSWWRPDLVTFFLGCSHSFEEALAAAGLPLRHVEHNVTVPMYRTNIRCTDAGPFRAPLVVSMRPFRPRDAIRAIEITARYPAVHGAPVHLGMPNQIGIANLGRPDFGDAVPVRGDELPLFWACGVTPQLALAEARIAFAITHAPGRMLVVDMRNDDLTLNKNGMECR
jgi:uncharacterized protein YcsI (UPF0317 family)